MNSFKSNRRTAIQAANEELWDEHPELQGRQLTLGPDDTRLRREWMEKYQRKLNDYESGFEEQNFLGTGTPRNIVLSCNEHSADQHQTLIYLGYTVVVGSQHHTFVIAENPDTHEKYITRAGPSANGPSQSSGASSSSASGGSLLGSSGDGGAGGFGFGTIRAQYGKWSETLAFDRPSATVEQQYIGVVDIPYSQTIDRMKEFAKVTNENAIPYFPTGPNSNSYAFTFVESLGLARPIPALSTPGHEMGFPDNDLSYYP